MPTCKSCGAIIEWVRTSNAKNMPVDSAEFPLIPDPNGDVYAVDNNGNVVKGRSCSESEEVERWIYARFSHFSTCPHANEHRRTKT